MLEQELLAFCLEFYAIGIDGLYNKKTRRGLSKTLVGCRAGNTHHSGYVFIKIMGKLYAEHRLVWLMNKGSFPDGELDHEDNVKNNNHIDNLRLATRGKNCANRIGWSKSGYKGVYANKRGKPWQSSITIDKKVIQLGTFQTKEEAARAYDVAAIKHKGLFAKLNFDKENYL